MSAELENPYLVDSQFQSDNRFRQWLANMRKGSAKPENQIITRGKPENRNRTQGNRQPIEKINRAFFLMKQQPTLWTHNFNKAAYTSYECFYFKENVLYHGWSQFKNDNIPMSDVTLSDPYMHATRTCYMHEYGLKNGPMYKMPVPLNNMYVLWRRRDH